MSATRLVLVVLALATLAPATLATSFTVTATNFAWTPSSLQVDPGDVVTFTNGGGSHTWVSDDGMGSCPLPCVKTFPAAGAFDYHCGVHLGMRGTVLVGPPPTLTIEAPTAGQTVQWVVRVEGTASQSASGVALVRVRIGSGALVDATLGAPGAATTTWIADVDSRLAPNGAQSIHATVTDVGGREASTTVGVTVSNPPEVDLRATALFATTGGLTRSTLTLSYRNDGNVDSGPHVVLAEYFADGAWHPISARSVASLAPATGRSAVFYWDSDGLALGRFDVRATVDADGRVAERDESNNARSASAAFVSPLLPGVDLTRVQ